MCVCYTSHIVHHAKSVHVVNGRIIVTRSFTRSFSYICRRREFRDAFVFFLLVCTFFSSSFHSLQIWLVRWIELCAFLFLIVCFYSRTVCTHDVYYTPILSVRSLRDVADLHLSIFFSMRKRERKVVQWLMWYRHDSRWWLLLPQVIHRAYVFFFCLENYFYVNDIAVPMAKWIMRAIELTAKQRVCSHSTVAINWNQMTISSQYGQMR